MATIHQATLSPSKLDLLCDYLPGIASLGAVLGDSVAQVGAYRFDDPAGEVGIETHILTSDAGGFLQIPLTYRAAPLLEAEEWFVGMTRHSVLGDRWVYNGAGDAVYVDQLVRTIVGGGSEVAEVVQTPDGPVERQPSVHVRGSGDGSGQLADFGEFSSSISGREIEIVSGAGVARIALVLDGQNDATSEQLRLTGTWASSPEPTLLASLSA